MEVTFNERGRKLQRASDCALVPERIGRTMTARRLRTSDREASSPTPPSTIPVQTALLSCGIASAAHRTDFRQRRARDPWGSLDTGPR